MRWAGSFSDDAEAVRYRLTPMGRADAQQPRGHVRQWRGGPQGRCRSREMVSRRRRSGSRQWRSYNLGVMYANGKGVLKDDAEAVKWTRLAADQGLANAQYTSGSCTTMAKVSSRTMPKPCAGIAWPLSRVTPMRSAASESCTTMVRESSRIPCLHTCGPTSQAQMGNETARELRDNLERRHDLAPRSVRATELARTCMTSDYKDCEP